MPQRSPASPERRAWDSISHHPLWSAVIAGLIVAAIVGLVHTLGGNSTSYKSEPPIRPSAGNSPVRPSRSAARSSPPASSPTPPQAAPQPSPTLTIPAIRLLRPVSQPGWVLAWHQKVSIGPQGITLGISGPQIDNGSNYDLQYVPGNGNGWEGYSIDIYAFDYWPYKYRPGPATISGTENSAGGGVTGTQAHVGDREYVTFLTSGGTVGKVAYMQIVGIGKGSIVADMWVWIAS